ncbi:hypothetical protein A0H81_09281 [Grifola frondosa]|uniref:Uncharacterized protein n=1 Tax=Grifola frondosa TaxID=5627 RepID=A0A1C7M2N3_GRIFR|nr:hypothetical protein A0H81_09281 [Grifola frondosa]
MDQPHSQMPSVDSEYDTVPTHIFPDADDVIRRQRTLSLTSTLLSSTSAAPSFAHTVFSAFLPERDCDLDPECRDEPEPSTPDTLSPRIDDEQQRAFAAELSGYPSRYPRARTLSCAARWRRYFRPLGRRAYYAALFHLLILNFPYALLAWVYLFVFTLTGTTTLMALPLGAVVFFSTCSVHACSVVLALQTTFHGPLAYSAPSPPLPIFTRLRAPPLGARSGT